VFRPEHDAKTVLTQSSYIFTELASGGDLYSYMQSHGGYLDDYNSRVITRQVALAVQFIHSKGIVHRDIKAENVLVTGTHFGGRVILTDFGFAVNVNPTTGRMLSKLGTPGYVAP
jgi:serine/threonine protein kinase